MEPVINESAEVFDLDKPLEVERATFGDRFFAALVDNIMLNIPLRIIYIFFFLPIITQGSTEKALLASIYYALFHLLVILGYFALYAYTKGGQTLGKKWNKIKVVDKSGHDLSLGRFLFRELVARGIPVLGGLLFGGYAYLWVFSYLAALTHERLAVHDMIAGTQVIKVK